MPNQNASITSPNKSATHGSDNVAVETDDLAHDALDKAADVAHEAGDRAVSFVRRTSVATGTFVRLHPLPLTALGASLGWLFLSMRASRTSARRFEVESRRPRLGDLDVDRPLAQEGAHRGQTKRGTLLSGRGKPLDFDGAVRELGAMELADRAADLTVLDPDQLYLHRSQGEQGTARSRTSPARAPAPAGSIIGWYHRRSAFGRTVDEVIERLHYPAT